MWIQVIWIRKEYADYGTQQSPDKGGGMATFPDHECKRPLDIHFYNFKELFSFVGAHNHVLDL